MMGSMVPEATPLEETLGASVGATRGIPRRVIQLWGGSRPFPLLGQAAAANLRLLNPGFEYVLFDDQAMSNLLDHHYPQYRSVFDAFAHPIQRYDFFRYLAVYHFGGFYFDVDVLLAQELSPLLGEGCVFPFERLTWSELLRDEHDMDWEVGNYAFGATPRHPFMAAVIANCVRAQTDRRWRERLTHSVPRLLRDELLVIYTTGPGLVSRTLAEYTRAEHPVRVLFTRDVCDRRNGWNRFGDFGVHLGSGLWRKASSAWRRRLLGFVGRRAEARAIHEASKRGARRMYPGNGSR